MEKILYMNSNAEEVTKKHYPDHIFLIILANAFLFAIEGYFSYLALSGSITFTTLLIVHIPLVILSILLVILYYRLEWNYSFPLLSALALIFMGALGPLFVGLAAILYFFFENYTSLPTIYKELFHVSEKYNLINIIYERLIYAQDTFNPEKLPTIFLDILVYGSEKQKRVAIDRILRHFRPEFSTALYKALNDKSNSIRVLAASAVNRIDSQYMDQNRALEKKYNKNPDDKNCILNYAEHCELYSRLVFIDDERREQLKKKTIELYKKYLQSHSEDQKIALFLARLYNLKGKYQSSADCLENFVHNYDTATEEVYRCYFSAIFQLKKYHEIRTMTNNKDLKIHGQSVEFDNTVDQIILWKNGLKTMKISMEEAHARS